MERVGQAIRQPLAALSKAVANWADARRRLATSGYSPGSVGYICIQNQLLGYEQELDKWADQVAAILEKLK